MTTSASTGSDQQFSQSTRLRTEAAREAAKPKQVAEGVADIYLAAYNARVAADKARLEQEIKSGKVIYK